MCREVLEDNRATRDVLDLAKYPKPPFAQWVPDWLWSPVQRRLIAPFMVWLCVGLYDPPVRELLGYNWSDRDEWLHRRFGDAVRLVFNALPWRLRKHPRARASWDRATGRIPPMRLWCTPRRVTCRRSTSAAIPCITARRSEPRYRRSANGVHPAPSK